MTRFRFRLSTLVGLVAVSAVVLGVFAGRWRADRPRSLRPSDSPFLVLAQVYKGPGSEQRAYAYAAELRSRFRLTSYLFQAPPSRTNSEPNRTPETVVLVGDARTFAEAQALLKRIKKLKPRSPTGLRKFVRATITQNPLMVYLPPPGSRQSAGRPRTSRTSSSPAK